MKLVTDNMMVIVGWQNARTSCRLLTAQVLNACREELVPLMVKHIRSLRSQLSKVLSQPVSLCCSQCFFGVSCITT